MESLEKINKMLEKDNLPKDLRKSLEDKKRLLEKDKTVEK